MVHCDVFSHPKAFSFTAWTLSNDSSTQGSTLDAATLRTGCNGRSFVERRGFQRQDKFHIYFYHFQTLVLQIAQVSNKWDTPCHICTIYHTRGSYSVVTESQKLKFASSIYFSHFFTSHKAITVDFRNSKFRNSQTTELQWSNWKHFHLWAKIDL